MSSWVAPGIAAEIWGVSIDHVLDGIANGSIPSYVDGQFLFVDMAGIGFPRTTPRPQVIEPDITDAEIEALTFQPAGDYTKPVSSNDDTIIDDGILMADEEMIAEEGEIFEEDEDSTRDVSDWRSARDQTSRIRRPPQSEAA
ncbi:MAG TPA: hypothetical protein VGG44_05095 [Tepidisphaeraceae bacterium]|jgi:hypothetical protein